MKLPVLDWPGKRTSYGLLDRIQAVYGLLDRIQAVQRLRQTGERTRHRVLSVGSLRVVPPHSTGELPKREEDYGA
jgi:hypothetical protein